MEIETRGPKGPRGRLEKGKLVPPRGELPAEHSLFTCPDRFFFFGPPLFFLQNPEPSKDQPQGPGYRPHAASPLWNVFRDVWAPTHAGSPRLVTRREGPLRPRRNFPTLFGVLENGKGGRPEIPKPISE